MCFFCLGEITDFISFYTLPSTVMHHQTHKTLKAAYAFYNVALKTNLEQLMQVCVLVAVGHWEAAF